MKIRGDISMKSDVDSLKGLHCRIEKPENIEVEDGAFEEKAFEEYILFIPPGTRWAYRHHPIFGKFKNIEIER